MKKFIVALIGLALVACSENEPKLPYVGNFDIEYKTVNGVEIADTVYPKMVDFMFLNQDSVETWGHDMEGKIWISDFFFTSCPTICPTMTTQMKRVAKGLEDVQEQIQIMSFSIDPKRDQPSVLRRYREKYGITNKNWIFLTGDEARTHRLGIENFQVFANEDPNSAGGYAHSPAFTLIDKEGYIRGVYVGTETEDVDRLIKDVHRLIETEYGKN